MSRVKRQRDTLHIVVCGVEDLCFNICGGILITPIIVDFLGEMCMHLPREYDNCALVLVGSGLEV